MQTSHTNSVSGSMLGRVSAAPAPRQREFLAVERLRSTDGTRQYRQSNPCSIADAPKALSLERIGARSMYDLAEMLP